MAIAVSVRSTFLSLEMERAATSCQRRSRSEDLRRTAVENCDFTTQHLANLQQLLSIDVSELFAAVEVCQSGSGRRESPSQGLRALGKMGSVLSSSSVSTMAPSEESDGELSPFARLGNWVDCEEPCASPLPSGPTLRESKHGCVPKHVNLADRYAKAKREGLPITTVMVRNLPIRCSQRELTTELERAGFRGCFDFLYVPLDLGTMSNVGYAFVNFTDPMHAARCMELLPDHQFQRQRKGGKGVAVCAAHMQGLEANLQHYEKSAVNTSRLRQRRPVVMNVLTASSHFSGF